MKRAYLAVIAALSLAASAAAADDPYREMAEKLSAPAGKNLKTVALLPFGCAESSGTSRDGRVLGERLAVELINLGKFTVIDPGRFSGTLAKAAFRPEAGAGPELVRRLRKEFGADAIIAGMSASLADGRTELTARLIKTANASVVTAVRAAVARDWGAPAAVRNLRAALRALARQGVRAGSAPERLEFARIKAASLAARLSIVALGGREKLADFEIEAWKTYPAETVSVIYYFCSATDCSSLGVTGEGYYKAYFADGFVLQLDEAGDLLDCYYPERSFARLRMRLLAKSRPGRNMAEEGEWGKFQEVMDYKYVPVPDKRDPDSLRTEIDKWRISPDEKVTGTYYPEMNGRPDLYRVMFPDGFELDFDGPSGAIKKCGFPGK